MRRLSERRPIVWGAFGALAALLVYARGLTNGFVSDDWCFLYDSSKIESFRQLASLVSFDTGWFVRPTQLVLTWLLFGLAGPKPFVFHASSLALHVANVLLFARLAGRWLGAFGRPSAAGAPLRQVGSLAIFAALLFAVNSRHHEAVLWYSSISELLACFFALSCLTLFDAALDEAGSWKSALLFAASIGAAALAILSKESAVVLPVATVLVFGLHATRAMPRRAVLARCAAYYAAFFAVWAVWARLYFVTSAAPASSQIERSGIQLLDASLLDRALRFVQFFNAPFYGARLLNDRVPLLVVELFVIVTLAALALVRRRFLWLFALLWTFLLVSPVASMISKDLLSSGLPLLKMGIGGERYLYTPAAGVSLLIVCTFAWLLQLQETLLPTGRRLASAGTICILAGLTALNAEKLVRQERQWHTAGEIAREVIESARTRVPDPRPGEVICIGALPDSRQYRYIFRNCADRALWLAYGRNDFQLRAGVRMEDGTEQAVDPQGCTVSYCYDDNAPGRLASGPCEAQGR